MPLSDFEPTRRTSQHSYFVHVSCRAELKIRRFSSRSLCLRLSVDSSTPLRSAQTDRKVPISEKRDPRLKAEDDVVLTPRMTWSLKIQAQSWHNTEISIFGIGVGNIAITIHIVRIGTIIIVRRAQPPITTIAGG